MKYILITILCLILTIGCSSPREEKATPDVPVTVQPDVQTDVLPATQIDNPSVDVLPATQVDNLSEDMDLLKDEDIDLSELDNW